MFGIARFRPFRARLCLCLIQGLRDKAACPWLPSAAPPALGEASWRKTVLRIKLSFDPLHYPDTRSERAPRIDFSFDLRMSVFYNEGASQGFRIGSQTP